MKSSIHFQEGVLKGYIKSDISIIGKVKFPTGYEDYRGTYTVVPNFNEQSLDTNDKHLTNDITVESIPYSEVSNPSGGFTINIGG